MWYESDAPSSSSIEYVDVASSSSGQYIYALTESDGAYISSDSGNTWTLNTVTEGYIAVAVATSCDGSYAYIAVDNEVFVSSDYGGTWSPSSASMDPKSIACSCSGQYVYVTDYGSYMYQSSNYGNTFAQLTNSPSDYQFGVACDSTGQNVFIATIGGSAYLYQSTNYGTNWTAITGYSFTQCNAVATDSTGTNIVAACYGVWVSNDGGSTWTETFSVGVTAVYSSSSGQYMALASENTGEPLQLSSNYGTSWTIQSVAADPYVAIAGDSSGQRLVAVNGDAAGNSIYLGVNQTFAPTLVPTLKPSRPPSVSPSLTPTAPTALPSDAVPSAAPSSLNYLWSIRDDNITQQQGTMSCSNDAQYAVSCSTFRTYVSRNYGANFTTPSDLDGISATGCSVSANGSVMAVCSSSPKAVYISTNYGVSWKTVYPIASGDWTSIAVDGSGQNMIVAGGYIYYSSNFGQNWTVALYQSNAWNSVYINRGGPYAVASVYGLCYMSNTSGASWTLTGSPNTQQFVRSTISSDGQYLTGAGDGLYYSLDGGLTWSVSPSSPDNAAIYTLTASSSGQVVVMYSDQYYQSADYGQTFQTAATAPACTVMTCSSSCDLVLGWDGSAKFVYAGYDSSLTNVPTSLPTLKPTTPTTIPSLIPSRTPSCVPSLKPTTGNPSSIMPSSAGPSLFPNLIPSVSPSMVPSSGSTTATPTTAAPTILINYTWTTVNSGSLPVDNVFDISCSDNGQYVLTCEEFGTVYMSTNAGYSWTQPAQLPISYEFIGISVSANGSVMAACSYSSPAVYVSWNYGLNWTSVNSQEEWQTIAVDSTGQNMIVAGESSQIYYSSDSGRSWTRLISTVYSYEYLYISKGGPYAIAATIYDGFYRSADSGASWTKTGASTAYEYIGGFISNDGQYLLANGASDGLYISYNAGLNWTQVVSGYINAVTGSLSGQIMLVYASYDTFYQSSDYGISFQSLSSTPSCGAMVASSSASLVICKNHDASMVYNGVDNSLPYSPTAMPSVGPTSSPSEASYSPTAIPSMVPSFSPSMASTGVPSLSPTSVSASPSFVPSINCSSVYPSKHPIVQPSSGPSVASRSAIPSVVPSGVPSEQPSVAVTSVPTWIPSEVPTAVISVIPSVFPTSVAPSALTSPSVVPTLGPTNAKSFDYSWSTLWDDSYAWSAVASSSSGMNVIAGAMGGIFVSADFGVSWLQSNAPNLSWVDVATSSNGSFCVAVGSLVGYKSLNYGRNWTSVILPSQKWSSVATSSDGLIVAICANPGDILISFDKGDSFQYTDAPEAKWASIAVSALSTYIAAVVENGGVYVSADSGNSWSIMSSAPTDALWSALGISQTGQFMTAAINGGGIYNSSDFGLTWSESNAAKGIWVSLASTSVGELWFAAMEGGNVYVSYSFGGEWLVSVGSNSSQWAAVASNGDGSQLFVVSSDLVIDSAVSSLVPTEAPTAQPALITISPTPKPTLFISLAPTSLSSYVWNASDAPSASWVSITSSSSGQFVVAVATNSESALYAGGVYYSSDYGYVWSESAAGNHDWLSVASDSTGQFVVAGTSSNGLYYSSDFGHSWSVTATSSVSWSGLCAAQSGQVWFAATNGHIWTSDSFGTSWSELNDTKLSWQSITCSSSGQFVATAGTNGIYFTLNGGVTWTLGSGSTEVAWTSIASNSTGQLVVAAAGVQGLFRSVDFGASWSAMSAPNVVTAWSALCMDSSGQTVGLISTSPNSIYISNNGGSSWSTATSSAYWSAIAVDGSGSMLTSAVNGGTIFVGNGNSSNVIVLNSPTASPTSLDSTDSNSANQGIYSNSITFGSFLICVPGAIVLLSRLILLWSRQKTDQSLLNQLGNVYWESFESAFKAVNIVLSFNSLVVAYSDGALRATVLLLLSRLVIAFVWVFFLFIFFLPGNQQCCTIANLSLYLSNKTMQQKIGLNCFNRKVVALSMRFIALGGMMAGLFDLTLFRLLPWTASEFTTAVQGYPNMFAVRSCLYGTLLSTLLQSISSIVSFADNVTVDTLTFLFVSLFNLVLSLLSTILWMQMGSTSSLQVSIIMKNKTEDIEDLELQQVDKKDDNPEEDCVMEIANPMIIDNTTATLVEETKTAYVVPITEKETEDQKKKENPVVYDEENIYKGEVDERGILFVSKVEYAEETMDILKEQLSKKGETPLQYIPLAKIKAELDVIFAAANNGQPYDEARLDFLLTCMDYNPEYRVEKAAEDKKWRDDISVFSAECLYTMRGYIPPNIFHSSIESLKNDCQFSVELSKRLFTKKCLWLVRILPSDIERMHIAELQGRFNPQGQGLDIVELAAIYAAIPENFGRDHKKIAWRLSLEKQLKDLEKDRQANKLIASKKRHPAYKNQIGLFAEVEDMHSMQVVSGSDAFGPRRSFLMIGRSEALEVDEEQEKKVAGEEKQITATVVDDDAQSGAVGDALGLLKEKLNANLLSRQQERSNS